MGNENERKRDPAENREARSGHQWDDVKSGNSERNVGLTGDAGFGPGGAGVTGSSAGTAGIIGGSAEFLSGQSQEQSGYGSQGGPAGSTDPGVEEIGSETKQVLTGDQSGGSSFGGQSGSGTSAIAANNSSADLGAGGPPGAAGRNQQGSDSRDQEPKVGPGGQSEIGGASDLGGGETGQGDGGGFIGSRDDKSDDYLQKNGNPESGFAERGRGASNKSDPTADRH